LPDADVVVQYVKVAELLDAGLHHLLAVAGLRDIGFKSDTFAALLLDGAFGLLGGLEVIIHGHHPGPLAGEDNGGCLAVADASQYRTGAGDDGHLPFKTFSHRFPP
jgi:hypothetical protein